MNAPEAKAATEPQAAEITAHFNAAMLRWVSPCRAPDSETRNYLRGIHITPNTKGDGVYLIATNGRFMAVAFDAEGFASAPVTVRTTAAAINACSKKHDYPEERKASLAKVENKRLTLLNRATSEEIHLQAGDCLVAGLFPDFRRLFLNTDELIAGGDAYVQAHYLTSITAQLPQLSGISRPVRILRRASKSPATEVQFIHVDGLPFAGLIMPLRAHDDRPFGWFL
jgi:hypothetical protein